MCCFSLKQQLFAAIPIDSPRIEKLRGMKRVAFLQIAVMSVLCPCMAQSDEDMQSILRITGVSVAEELDSDVVEILSELLADPLKINVESPDRLVSAGVLSGYQAASLSDYLLRHGDLVCLTEFSLIDGFDPDLVKMLSPFVSLEPARIGSSYDACRLGIETVTRASSRIVNGITEYGYSGKYKVSYGDVLSANISALRSYDSSVNTPQMGSFNISAKFPHAGLAFLIGDFNARFGQGLVLWTGMTAGAADSPSSFRKNAAGLSSTWSFSASSSLTGAAFRWNRKHFVLSAAFGLPEMKDMGVDSFTESCLPIVNLAWYGDYGQISLTHLSRIDGLFTGYSRMADMKTSVDLQMCPGGVNVYSEAAYDWVNRTIAALGGCDWGEGDSGRLGIHLRYYPPAYASTWSSAVRSSSKCSNEYGIAFSGESDKGQASFDAAYYPVSDKADKRVQLKSTLRWRPSAGDHLSFDIRFTERWRDWGQAFRTAFRTDISLCLDEWSFTFRTDVLKCSGYGLLAYLEESYRADALAVHFRQGAFKVDEWDDRIYVYERDAPGSFNVPAFYGRGVWASLYSTWRLSAHCSMYLRLFCVAYPFMHDEAAKPGKAELRIQFRFSL